MKLDIKKAMYSPFIGDKWLQTLMIGCLLFEFGQILFELQINMPYKVFTYMIGSLTSLVMVGYIIQNVHNEINNKDNIPFDWTDCLKYINHALYISLPIYLYFFLLFFILLLPIQTYFTRLLITHYVSFKLDIAIQVSIDMIILSSIIFPYISAVFAQDFSLKTCFKITNLILPIKKAFKELMISIGVSLGLFIPYSILCLINYILFNQKLKIAFLLFPIALIIYNLFAQTYKIALYKTNPITKGEN